MKKWRNKITGEINEFMVHKRIEDSENGNPVYAPFDGHIDDWEDYEEPKSGVKGIRLNDMISGRHIVEIDFTKVEEAEKAVERLRAWKRLKDKGFRFTGFSNESIGYEIKELSGDFALDLDLLFNGGEE